MITQTPDKQPRTVVAMDAAVPGGPCGCHAPASAHNAAILPYSGRGHREPVPSAAAITFVSVSVRYAPHLPDAASDITFTVHCGERVALTGPNGAGKSTVLAAAAGLMLPHHGQIRIFGNAVGACHHRTAWVPQRTEVDWRFPVTVREFVMTGRYVHLGWCVGPGADDRELVSYGLWRLGLTSIQQRRIGELSGGQRQRALLARALVQEASIFLLDEPLNALDTQTQGVVHRILAEETAKGGCVLAAHHDLGSLSSCFDRSIQLREGRMDHSPR
ncbi:MAG: metal ABC transporter ATP-binding protein [Planctomycetaceae bacterium]